MKICLACSAGGHLTEIMQLSSFYEKHDHYFLTFSRRDSKELADRHRVHFVRDTSRSVPDSVISFLQSVTAFFRERPDIIVSTGAGVAVPTCYLAKLARKKVVFIESFCRVDEPSLSGRMVHPVADLFLVQWKSMLKHYPKARYGGPVL